MIRWETIPSFESYEINDRGDVRRRVKAKTRQALIPMHPTKLNGYLRVGLRSNNKYYSRFVHTLVMLAFVGPKPDGMQVCHNDNNPFNNNLSNLRYDTPKGNSKDKRANGTFPSGEANGNAALSRKDVLYIRNVYKRYSRTHGSGPLSKQFGVTQECILNAATGRAWAST
jgi:hypothetical protein